MPLVFIHGVNVRQSPADIESRRVRDEYFTRLLYSLEDGVPTSTPLVSSPYWGQFGAELRFGGATLRRGDSESFSMGAGDLDGALLQADVVIPGDGNNVLLHTARESVAAATDLLFCAAAQRVDDMRPQELVDLAEWANAYARREPHPVWLEGVVDDAGFVDALIRERSSGAPSPSQGRREAFGFSGVPDCLRIAMLRIAESAGRIVDGGGVEECRRRCQGRVTHFLGDVFVYLHSGGRVGCEGRIPQIVCKGIHDASVQCETSGGRLIVVGHSMGGVIAYDLLTHELASLTCDVLVTVGSQVALFEELGLFRSSRSSPCGPGERIRRPTNVRRWLNVFDPRDPLGLAASGLFEDVEDYEYDTGGAFWSAHQLYLLRASFHSRLRERLQENSL